MRLAIPLMAIVLAPQTAPQSAPHSATFYDLAGHRGNCSYAAPANGLYVALATPDYAKGAYCGAYLDVTGPRGKVRVKIVDSCPPCPKGRIDLSARAFARVADPAKGLVSVSYKIARNPRAGHLAFRVKDGSSRWWMGLLVYNHGNPLRSVEIRTPSGWRALTHTDYNYWLTDNPGPGPFTVRVSDVRGHRAIVKRVELAPEKLQRTVTRLY
jgi:expansin (peptidoglycan-binding protein)